MLIIGVKSLSQDDGQQEHVRTSTLRSKRRCFFLVETGLHSIRTFHIWILQLAVDNETYFLANSTSAYGIRLSECCREISLSADLIQELVRQMHAVAHKCDYDENTPGNGFRFALV